MPPPERPRKQLTDDERTRVLRKLRALQNVAARRAAPEEVFFYCDCVRLQALAGTIPCDDVARLRRLFDEHGIT